MHPLDARCCNPTPHSPLLPLHSKTRLANPTTLCLFCLCSFHFFDISPSNQVKPDHHGFYNSNRLHRRADRHRCTYLLVFVRSCVLCACDVHVARLSGSEITATNCCITMTTTHGQSTHQCVYACVHMCILLVCMGVCLCVD